MRWVLWFVILVLVGGLVPVGGQLSVVEELNEEVRVDMDRGVLVVEAVTGVVCVSVPDKVPVGGGAEGSVIGLDYSGFDLSVYEVDRGFEVDFVLYEVPEVNVFSLKIDGVGLNWFYQPPMNLIHNMPGWVVNSTHAFDENGSLRYAYVSEDCVGSYAVYSDKSGNRFGTGKVFHVYRPRVFDSKGAVIWGDLSYSEGVLSVTVDREWLDKAVYPVRVDPTFGRTSVGASLVGYNNAHLRASNGTTVPAGGILNNVSFYAYTAGGVAHGMGAVYDSASNLVEGEVTGLIVDTVPQWRTVNMSWATNLTGSTLYWATAQMNRSSTGANTNFRGDFTGVGTSWSRGDITFTVGAWDNPATWFGYNYYVSVYASYGAGGAGPGPGPGPGGNLFFYVYGGGVGINHTFVAGWNMSGLQFYGYANSSGYFDAGNMSSGVYVVTASHPDYRSLTDQYNVSLPAVVSVELSVGGGLSVGVGTLIIPIAVILVAVGYSRFRGRRR